MLSRVMPSAFATVLCTWAAIYAYVGAFYSMLYLRRRSREYLAFALTCVGLSVWSAGSALQELGHGAANTRIALRLSYVGGFAAVAFFCELAAAMTGHRGRRVVTSAYLVSALGIAATSSGLLFDSGSPQLTAAWAHALADRGVPYFSMLGAALVALALGLSTWAVLRVLRAIPKHRELRPFALASALVLLASAYEALGSFFGFPTLHLIEHAGLLEVVAISWLLMRRYLRAAEELGARTEALRTSYGELRVTQEELVRKEQLAAVGELSAVIAHEVRNPLAIIKNAVSSMRRPTLRPADRGVLLGILDEEVDRLSRLVRDLLAYARPVEPRGRAIALAEILTDLVDETAARHEAPETVRVELDLDRCPPVHGDPDLLRQAITNVVDNALSAMSGGGTLTLRAEPTTLRGEPAVAIECIDTGDGMDALVLGKARDPFFTTRAAGTGLGLAIVERVVKNHHGTLTIESEPGAGTSVRIVLPRERTAVTPPEHEDLT